MLPTCGGSQRNGHLELGIINRFPSDGEQDLRCGSHDERLYMIYFYEAFKVRSRREISRPGISISRRKCTIQLAAGWVVRVRQ
jgi:hypothetical protein